MLLVLRSKDAIVVEVAAQQVQVTDGAVDHQADITLHEEVVRPIGQLQLVAVGEDARTDEDDQPGLHGEVVAGLPGEAHQRADVSAAVHLQGEVGLWLAILAAVLQLQQMRMGFVLLAQCTQLH